MKVTILNNYRGSGNVRVHRSDCRDVAKERPQSDSVWQLETTGDIAEAVVKDLNDSFGWTPDDDEPQPWHVSDITVLPCCQ